MKLKLDINGKTGLYLGTEIDEKWWKRYTEDKLWIRGNGQYWYDDDAFYFLRYLTKEPVTIPMKDILEFKTGKWHAGRWCFGYPVLKIIWLKDGINLSSGFLISKDNADIRNIISELKNKINIWHYEGEGRCIYSIIHSLLYIISRAYFMIWCYVIELNKNIINRGISWKEYL